MKMVKTVFWATFCFWGSILALFPAISIHISENAYSNSALNEFVKLNKEMLLSIGTLLLISFLAILQTYISNYSSEKREESNRRTQTELKLAEFRQEWIDGLRDDLSEFASLLNNDSFPSNENFERMVVLHARIMLRMNNGDVKYPTLLKAMSSYLKAARSEKGKMRDIDITTAHTTLITTSQDLLKTEWNRLKRDLQESRQMI